MGSVQWAHGDVSARMQVTTSQLVGAAIVSAKVIQRARKMADSARRMVSSALITLDISIGQLLKLADRTGRDITDVQALKVKA